VLLDRFQVQALQFIDAKRAQGRIHGKHDRCTDHSLATDALMAFKFLGQRVHNQLAQTRSTFDGGNLCATENVIGEIECCAHRYAFLHLCVDLKTRCSERQCANYLAPTAAVHLLDINVLALAWLHRTHDWFNCVGSGARASCAITELGFVRNSRITVARVTPRTAATLLSHIESVG